MKKIVPFGALAFALAVSLAFTSCAAIAEMVVANIPAKYTMRSIVLRTAGAYQTVFNEPAPAENGIQYYICTREQLDAFFELAKLQTTASIENTPRRGLTLEEVNEMLRTIENRGFLQPSMRGEMTNALESNKCFIYTTGTTGFAGKNPLTWEINGFFRE